MGFMEKYGADSDDEYNAKGEKCAKGGYYKKGGKFMQDDKKDQEGGKTVPEDALDKSLGQLEQFVKANSPVDRKNELFQKSLTGELGDAEKAELFQLLGGPAAQPAAQPESLAKSLQQAVASEQPVEDMVEVSDYISGLHEGLNKSLGVMGDQIQSDAKRQQEFNLVLARAVGETAKMVKSLGDAVSQMATVPARGPKSRRTPQATPMEKSFANEQPTSEKLSKSQVLDGLMSIAQKQGNATIDGRSIPHWVARLESAGGAEVPASVVTAATTALRGG